MSEKESEILELPLCTEDWLSEIVPGLKKIYQRDRSPEVQEALKTDFARQIRKQKGKWFQRIEFPAYNLSTTSDHELVRAEGDRINSLGGLLTLHEAAVLRPLPKWQYIKPLLPSLKNKTVMEVGSNAGFFSLKFAQMGAKAITGVEVIENNHQAACWSAMALGLEDKVNFINSDIMLDLTLQPHDVVFMSAVHVHFVTVFYGLLRSVNLARETLIIDSGGPTEGQFGLRLFIAEDEKRIAHHAWHLSGTMMVEFLYLIGVEPSRITRYKAPWGNHVLYIIDTSNVNNFRETRGYPIYIKEFLKLAFKTP